MKAAPAVLLSALAVLAGLLAPATAAQVAQATQVTEQSAASYLVAGVQTREDRSAVAGTGAGIDEVRPDAVVVRATPAERDAIKRLGFTAEPLPPRPASAAPEATGDFPPGDSAYHTYAETVAELNAAATARPATVRRFTLGSSYQGRELAGVRISDDVQDRGVEPAVLFMGMHHAREHLTTEVVLSLVRLFAESSDPAVRALVATRQIYLVPQLNPDGGEFDIATGQYAFWRKNRQPNAGTAAVGTDPNRNYGYRWGCCGGSSGSPSSETYRGPAPFSAPEVDAVRRFVEARPHLSAAISYHSYGDLILYPFGYTYTDLPADMDPVDHTAFKAMAAEMARTTGYTPQQSSDLYITDGDFTDWMYGTRNVYAFTFELSGYGYGFYPPASFIPNEVAKNRDAAVYLASMADCPIRAAGASCATRDAEADFDGDRDTDVSLYRPSTGQWYVKGGNPALTNWGTTGDVPVPRDYDGDGKTDVAVYRPTTGEWYVGGSIPSLTKWGTGGDVPVPSDYDGDGRSEVAVFRPATGQWFVGGSSPSLTYWGTEGDVPVPDDYDGDGKTDIAVYRPATGQWFVGGTSPSATNWGVAGDVPVPADYDGDGAADIAVYRPGSGRWYVGGTSPSLTNWGSPGDVPVPGDYNGDGRTDVAIFRSGQWYVGGSSPSLTPWGTSGDIPLPLPAAIRQRYYP